MTEEQAPEPIGRPGPGRTILIALVGAVALALVAALTLGGGDPPGDLGGRETGPVAVFGDGLSAFAGAEGDVAVGRLAPDFDATTFNGDIVQVRPGNGTGYVIAFFAHWCSHCQAEVPKLIGWIDRDGIPSGVKVVAVSTAVYLDRGNPPQAWFAAEGWPELVLRDSDESEVADAYGLRSFPYFVVVGTDGRVRARVSGGQPLEGWEYLLDQATRSGAVPLGEDAT
ncbi:MAG: TlpA disulfide reductase family protein [Acidimicrobiales bacterium]|nr:TlpA disulfide reductase family protein [Acidimicrobiales bacterium]